MLMVKTIRKNLEYRNKGRTRGWTFTETQQDGSFKFDRVKLGTVTVRLASDELGKSLRASTAGQQAITVSPRQTEKVSFGLVDFGSISGRVFNELKLLIQVRQQTSRGSMAYV